MLSRFFRTLTLCLTMVTAGLPGVVAIADALAEREAAGAPVHVEAEGGTDACPFAHASDCPVCTLLRHGAAPSPALARPVVTVAHAPRKPGGSPQRTAGAVLTQASPRAPPVV